MPPTRVARGNHVADLVAGKLYVSGGTTIPSAEAFNFDTGQWTTIAPPNRPRAVATSYVTQDAMGNPLWVLVGGQDTSGAVPRQFIQSQHAAIHNWWSESGRFLLRIRQQQFGDGKNERTYQG
jgi:hypothetical protein